jgi:hypothetical protein
MKPALIVTAGIAAVVIVDWIALVRKWRRGDTEGWS